MEQRIEYHRAADWHIDWAFNHSALCWVDGIYPSHWAGKLRPFIPFLRYLKMRFDMAKNARKTSSWQDIVFVNIPLNVQDKEHFRLWYEKNGASFTGELANLCGSGYKQSCRLDEDNDCFIASITCLNPSSPNFNKCLTARSSDFWEAWALIVYKHLEMVDDEVWPDSGSRNNWG